MRPVTRPTAEARARMRALAERTLSAAEWKSALAIPLLEAEREEALSLVRWFRRRYPTPLERLAYARRAYRRWRAAMPHEEKS